MLEYYDLCKNNVENLECPEEIPITIIKSLPKIRKNKKYKGVRNYYKGKYYAILEHKGKIKRKIVRGKVLYVEN